jgi:hypothetical protein
MTGGAQDTARRLFLYGETHTKLIMQNDRFSG